MEIALKFFLLQSMHHMLFLFEKFFNTNTEKNVLTRKMIYYFDHLSNEVNKHQ